MDAQAVPASSSFGIDCNPMKYLKPPAVKNEVAALASDDFGSSRNQPASESGLVIPTPIIAKQFFASKPAGGEDANTWSIHKTLRAVLQAKRSKTAARCTDPVRIRPSESGMTNPLLHPADGLLSDYHNTAAL